MTATWHLAIETTGRAGSFALLAGDRLVRQSAIVAGGRTAATFAEHIRDLLDAERLAADDVTLVSVAAGPGSFTGLRIGVTAAKTFCFAAGSKLAAVSTLDAIALAALEQRRADGNGATQCHSLLMSVAINAYRGQVFRSQIIDRDPDAASPRQWLVEQAPAAIDRQQWLEELQSHQQSAHDEYWAVGDAIDQLPGAVPPPFRVWSPTEPLAAFIGRLGWQAHLQDEHVDYWSLVPNYLRASAAEEKTRQA